MIVAFTRSRGSKTTTGRTIGRHHLLKVDLISFLFSFLFIALIACRRNDCFFVHSIIACLCSRIPPAIETRLRFDTLDILKYFGRKFTQRHESSPGIEAKYRRGETICSPCDISFILCALEELIQFYAQQTYTVILVLIYNYHTGISFSNSTNRAL
jgi:hypothetical protein